jgi:hypothetical protein
MQKHKASRTEVGKPNGHPVPARLHILLARNLRNALVIRRGPSKKERPSANNAIDGGAMCPIPPRPAAIKGSE